MTDTTHRAEVRTYGAFIDGQWADAIDGGTLESTDPATGEVVAVVAACTAADVAVAVRGAEAAFPAWRDTRPLERGRVLNRIADALREGVEHFAQLEAAENGKPIGQARGDVEGTARYFEFYAGLADKLGGSTIPLGEDYVSLTRREPYGVVGVIVPWNGPIAQAVRSIAPALVAGNVLVVKPSELTSTTCLELAELAIGCGLPPGALNVVTGFGTTAGAAVVDDPGVRTVVFTGSLATGRLVALAASKRLIPVTLELGGKSAHVLFADADLDRAVQSAWSAITANAGQISSVGSRLLVEDAIHDDVVERLTALNATVTIGPSSENAMMGPLTSRAQRDKVDGYVRIAEEEGATVILGGTMDPDVELPEAFVRPVLLTDVRNDMRVAQEEIFGPVLSISRFRGEEEAVAIANDSRYGLVAGVWTNDIGRAFRVAAQIEVGQVFINDEYFAGGVETPFGGVKESGYGREKGIEGALSYVHTKTVTARVRAERESA